MIKSLVFSPWHNTWIYNQSDGGNRSKKQYAPHRVRESSVLFDLNSIARGGGGFGIEKGIWPRPHLLTLGEPVLPGWGKE